MHHSAAADAHSFFLQAQQAQQQAPSGSHHGGGEGGEAYLLGHMGADMSIEQQEQFAMAQQAGMMRQSLQLLQSLQQGGLNPAVQEGGALWGEPSNCPYGMAIPAFLHQAMQQAGGVGHAGHGRASPGVPSGFPSMGLPAGLGVPSLPGMMTGGVPPGWGGRPQGLVEQVERQQQQQQLRDGEGPRV